MKKVEKFNARRYYQRSYGLFVDVERHEYTGETVIRMGSLVHIGKNMPVADRAVCCTFNTGREKDLSDEECLKSFAEVYWKFASDYIFYNISDKMGVNPFDIPYENDGDSNDSLVMDEFDELEIRRYKHKYGNQKYYLDVEIRRNPNNPDDVETNIYLLELPGRIKVLCDIYCYEVPKEKYKKILKDNMHNYKLIYRQNEVYQEYHICRHEKPDDDRPAMSNDNSFLNIPEGIDEELPFS